MVDDRLTFRDLAYGSYCIQKRTRDPEPTITVFDKRDARKASSWCKDSMNFLWQSKTFRQKWLAKDCKIDFSNISAKKANPTPILSKDCFVALWIAFRLHYALQHTDDYSNKKLKPKIKYVSDHSESIFSHNQHTTTMPLHDGRSESSNDPSDSIEWQNLDEGIKFTYIRETEDLQQHRKLVAAIAERYANELHERTFSNNGLIMEIDYQEIEHEQIEKIARNITGFSVTFVQKVFSESLYPRLSATILDEYWCKLKQQMYAEQENGSYETFGAVFKLLKKI
ncbi:hypothetical protein ATO00_13160 [Loigolactobacillus coryniformis subsp. coryniformis]|uniref:Uncharacterized protein n=1 Tax=Loigolactobacillus coryniformis subsp. coryniformis KCTC 3167 = DSM 20001 TaxID=913848 RepID=A0A0R1FA90_9LACO|nr:hypothetical protein [Loigolactobacillus coryniformis]ATO56142.1 hypothetical protein LC20001_11155 [Loigolactobacillus coryniformis subsp. coryniformis KCTC 3167 = DSM 20001]KRK16705.1 hypothetical protein FD22_GL001108 [Loigolactobacillus coryniformis subsp. coryniformis KCTC 3167 = DSM 20001]OEH89164.1 hypothetical protein ATO00_13160 [Loigolactobacillus coryniformis subsp. coryniformis]